MQSAEIFSYEQRAIIRARAAGPVRPKSEPISASATKKQSHVVLLGPFSGSTGPMLKWAVDGLTSTTLTSRSSERLPTNVLDRLTASQNPKLSPLHSITDSSGLRMFSSSSH
jgi:hypothetical protein